MAGLVFIDAKWDGNIELDKKTLDYLKQNKVKSVSLFASVQFLDVKKIVDQLKKLNIKVMITKAKRTNSSIQILGCDCYNDSFKENILSDSDMIIYVGDGLFHPKALLLAQIGYKDIKPVLLYNPISQSMCILDKKELIKEMNRMKRNLKMFVNAQTVGILVTIKFGQQYLNRALELKKYLEKQGKKTYIFIDNNIDFKEFDNFTFVDVWVNSACPRIGIDDIVNLAKPLINIKDAFNPIKALNKLT